MLEMNIDSIRFSLMSVQRVVILRVKESNKYLPIWIGPNEADSIAYKLQDLDVPRPLTHDLLGSIISTLGATVSQIVVSDLNEDTFFAKIVLTYNGDSLEIDSRPSDAIALAVRTGAPIFADDAVVEKAGVLMDEETGKPILSRDNREGNHPLREEEVKSLSAFTDFIETLDFEGIGGGEEKKPPETA